MDIIDNVGKYLEYEKVFLDMDEFRFQCKSHPDYPSLLSVIDLIFTEK